MTPIVTMTTTSKKKRGKSTPSDITTDNFSVVTPMGDSTSSDTALSPSVTGRTLYHMTGLETGLVVLGCFLSFLFIVLILLFLYLQWKRRVLRRAKAEAQKKNDDTYHMYSEIDHSVMINDDPEEKAEILAPYRPTPVPNNNGYDHLFSSGTIVNPNYSTMNSMQHNVPSVVTQDNSKEVTSSVPSVNADGQPHEYFKLEKTDHHNAAFSSENSGEEVQVDVHNFVYDLASVPSPTSVVSGTDVTVKWSHEPPDTPDNRHANADDNYFTLEATDDSVCGDKVRII